MKKEIVEKILNETETGYDLIAEKFSQTRGRFWKDLESIREYTHPGDIVFDYGCGNGRLLELIGDIGDIRYWGIDPSAKLIEFAKNRFKKENVRFSKFDLDQISLPFENDFFNTSYSIAVFHHIPSRELRMRIARELYRITKPGGFVVISVWNLWQRKYVKNVFRNWFSKLTGASNLDWNDCFISFTDNQGRIFNRFHHAFTEKELVSLLSQVGFSIEKIANGRNIVAIGKK